MYRFGSILGSVNSTIALVIKIRDKWSEIAGDVLASHSVPVRLKGTKLWVVCDSPLWVQQVGLLTPQILPRIKEYANIHVDNIDCKFGMLEKGGKNVHVPHKRTSDPPDIDPSVVAKIKDPELRRLTERLMHIKDRIDG
ncbi:MAG: DUF721 domain-containing protein [Deltaproteobacteria bacterium]|nr:DUF721 domain-containing protein [Deltaproteobacteria bacterium]